MNRRATPKPPAGRAGLRRRALLLRGIAAAAAPIAARAQARRLAKVGLLAAPAETNYTHHIAAIRQGLKQEGFFESVDYAFEFRWAGGRYEQLPALAADLVARKVDVIMTLGGGPPVRAAQAATATIPIIFHLGADPVRLGLVASMSRPGGNITGVTLMTNQMESKRLELLLAMVPRARMVGILANPANQSAPAQIDYLRGVAARLPIDTMVFEASTVRDLEESFARASGRVDALTILSDVFFTSNSNLLAEFAQRHRLPAIAHSREFAEAGGLMSYGTNLSEAYRQAGLFAGRILKGEKPGELPVIEPTRFDFLINLKTAQALALTPPPELLVFADEVIE